MLRRQPISVKVGIEDDDVKGICRVSMNQNAKSGANVPGSYPGLKYCGFAVYLSFCAKQRPTVEELEKNQYPIHAR